MTKLIVDAEPCKTVDEFPSGGRPDTYTYWTFGGLTLTESSEYSEVEIEVGKDEFKVGDVAYVVVAVWSTGDSFGHDEGSNAEALSVHKDRESAEKSVQVIEGREGNDLGDGYSLASFKPWDDYFDSLTYTKIISGVVT